MNYFPFHLGDYAAHTAHLEPMEDLAYRRLLDQYYLKEGPLPADIQVTAKLVRMRSMVADVESILKEFFMLTDKGWTHDRCDTEIAHMQDKQTKARASAAASVKSRQAFAAKKSQNRETAATENVNERSAVVADIPTDVQLPTPTPTPTPVKDSVPIGTGSKPPLITNPDEIIFGYGIALLVNAGTPEKQARSFLGGLRKHHGDDPLIDKLRECAKAKPLQPLEWLAAALPPGGTKAKPSKHTGFDKLNYQEGIEADGSFA